MLFCKECGESLSPGASFCKECGTSVTNEPAHTTPLPTNQPSKPMNPKTKKLIIAGVVVLGVLYGGYKAGESLTSKERKIDQIESALMDKNKDDLADLLVSTDKKLKVDITSLKGLMTYLDENPDEVQRTVNALREQSKYYDSIKSDTKNSQEYIESTMANGLFNLRKNGKTLFYDKYEITIKPVYMVLYTNYQDTILKVNGKEVAKASEPDFQKVIGPFFPGIYTVEAKLKNEFVTLKREQEVLLGEEERPEVELYLEGEEVSLHSDIDDTSVKGKVLLNGKELKINPFSQEPFGPVVTDGSLKAQVIADLPWGETKSEEFIIDDNEVEYDLSQDKKFQQSIMDTLVKNAQEWMIAYTNGDVNKLTTGANVQREEVAEKYAQAIEYGNFLKGSYLGTKFDLESLRLYKEDQWRASMDVSESYHSDYYSEAEMPELIDNTNNWTYYLVYDEEQKKWLVEKSEGNWGLNGENIKEYIEESPQEYTSKWASSSN